MKTYLIPAALVLAVIVCQAFFSGDAPEEKIRSHYLAKQKNLLNAMICFRGSVKKKEPVKILQHQFLLARMAYKEVEPYLEYYFELEVGKFNGPSIEFIEEEDPAAYHPPHGFQVIEEKLFSAGAARETVAMSAELDEMIALAEGLIGNASNFLPESYAMDAAMEALFRLTSLGIAGFDSPKAQLSLKEAVATLKTIQFVVQSYGPLLPAEKRSLLSETIKRIDAAGDYFSKHTDFNSFDRAYCITELLDPLARSAGAMIRAMELQPNPMRYSLIRKDGSLFDSNGLQPEVFFRDEVSTDARAELGKALFYEPMLSANGKRSCAGCHDPAKGFTDGLPRALQIDGHSVLARNTPTLYNAAFQRKLFADSRQPSLHHLILEVLGNSKEMNMSADTAMHRIRENPLYRTLYAKAYPESPEMRTNDLVSSIAMFLFTIRSYNARFDLYMRGDKQAMTRDEIRGFNLYMGKAKCGTCHFVPFMNGSKPPNWYYQESEVIGVPDAPDTSGARIDPDPGRYADLQKEFLRHAFKTPTLRNITLTAPYMHNGVYRTLDEVIDFYDRGGGAGIGIRLPNQSLPAEKLGLTRLEKDQLKAFLATLTSEN